MGFQRLLELNCSTSIRVRGATAYKADKQVTGMSLSLSLSPSPLGSLQGRRRSVSCCPLPWHPLPLPLCPWLCRVPGVLLQDWQEAGAGPVRGHVPVHGQGHREGVCVQDDREKEAADHGGRRGRQARGRHHAPPGRSGGLLNGQGAWQVRELQTGQGRGGSVPPAVAALHFPPGRVAASFLESKENLQAE